MTETYLRGTPALDTPHIRQVGLARPWAWLSAGWADMRAHPGISLAFGAVTTGLGAGMFAALQALDMLYLFLPLAAGFVFIAPILAVGLYEISRRHGQGASVDFGVYLSAIRRNPANIALFGLGLLLFLVMWVRTAYVLFAMFHGTAPMPGLPMVAEHVFFGPDSFAFLATGTALGAILTLVAFTFSAISLPMLIDRPGTNVAQAMFTSVRAVVANPRTMLFWAGLITLFAVIGIATMMIGLVVLMPLVGHASWHAYRDLVD